MATPSRYPIADEEMKETVNTGFFGLIAETSASVAFLHGYEITLDGDIVAPELCLANQEKASATAPPLVSINCFANE